MSAVGRFRRRVTIDFDELKLTFDERIERGLHAIGLPRGVRNEPQAHHRVHVGKRDGRSGDDGQHAIDDLRAEAGAGGSETTHEQHEQRQTAGPRLSSRSGWCTHRCRLCCPPCPWLAQSAAQKACPRLKMNGRPVLARAQGDPS